MGDQYYRKFFYILKRFAKNDDYKLSYELFGIKYELRFDSKYQVFYITFDDIKKYIGFKDAYSIIKENLQKRLEHMQISKFKYHTKDKNKKLVLSDYENKVYNRLIDLFIPYMYKEYFVSLNIFRNVDTRIILNCFYDMNVKVEFLRKILEIVSLDKSTLDEACISEREVLKTFSDGAWYEELKKFRDKGYIILKEKDNVVNEILLTEKFLITIKRLAILSFI